MLAMTCGLFVRDLVLGADVEDSLDRGLERCVLDRHIVLEIPVVFGMCFTR